MINVGLYRYEYGSVSTKGVLFLPSGKWTHTLELPWRDNLSGRSCVPEGIYTGEYLARSTSGKYRRVYWIRGVENRTGILIHGGNWPRDTRGCILPGTNRRGDSVRSSLKALNMIRAELGQESFTIEIRS